MRVIAGSARGRRLKSPLSAQTRATGDKVKGAMFSLLEALAYKLGFEPKVDEKGRQRFAAASAWPCVLDLYAGSGALGIEALSRGAKYCEFVESDARAAKLIHANLRVTGLVGRAVVHRTRAEQAVSTLQRSYDLILADPPYTDPEAERVLASLVASPRLTNSAVLVWEHHWSYPPVPLLGPLRLWRTRKHGLAAVSVYVRQLDDRSLMEGDGPGDADY